MGKKKVIQHKISQIRLNRNVLNEEQHRLERQIDAHFDDLTLMLQRRRQCIKYELSEICNKQRGEMKKYLAALDKQTKQILDSLEKCENLKLIDPRKMSTSQRRAKVTKIANKALENRSDSKIVIPAIRQKKDTKSSKKQKKYFVTMEFGQKKIEKFIENIGQIRRVLVPYPPKFEIFCIESNRIKLKVWDQQSGNNKMGKREKTEFIARIAEQHPLKNEQNESESDRDENEKIAEIMEEIIEVEEGKNKDDEEKEDDLPLDVDAVDDAMKDQDEEDEEFKYDDIQSKAVKVKQSKSSNRRRHSKKRKKARSSKKNNVDWSQYPVFKPHDVNDRKLMSNKYTIWIDSLRPNTTYLLRLRGLNKYGHGDWTKIYSFVTKLTSFEFKSCIVKDAEMKNAVFEILRQKLTISPNEENSHRFALKRLFCTEIHGFSAAKFHELVDEKKRILLIGESENGQIFGGYTELSWSGSKTDKWKNDANAFLFLLRNGKKQRISQIFDCVDPYNATRSNMNSGPCFGKGFDLLICDKCNKVANSYSVPKSFDIPSNVSIGGKKNFKIRNYEIFMVA